MEISRKDHKDGEAQDTEMRRQILTEMGMSVSNDVSKGEHFSRRQVGT